MQRSFVTPKAAERLRTVMASALAGNGTDIPSSLLHQWGRGEGVPYKLRRQILMDALLKAIRPSALPMFLRDMEFAEVAPAIDLPMSVVPPYRLKVHGVSCADKLSRFWEDSPALPAIDLMEVLAGIKRFRSKYMVPKGQKLSPLSYDLAFELSDNGRYLGWPVFGSSREYLPEVDKRSREFEAEKLHSGADALWSVYGYRSERGKPYAIWQYPRALMIHEKRYQMPLLRWLRHLGPFEAWNGRYAVSYAVTQMLSSSSRSPVISVDYSGFDASVPRLIIEEALRFMEDCFGHQHRRLFARLKHAFLDGAIAHPLESSPEKYELRIKRHRGVPSGSGWTNVVDCLCNLILLEIVAVHFGTTVESVQVQGDDGLARFNDAVGVDQISEYIGTRFGMKLSAQKSLVSDTEATYCRATYRRGFTGSNGLCLELRSIVRACGRMFGHEHWKKDWSHELDSIRYRMQLSSCQDHPAYHAAEAWLACWDRNGYRSTSDLIEKVGEDRVRSAFPDRFTGDRQQAFLDGALLTAEDLE